MGIGIDRDQLHRRLAESFVDAYARCLERGRLEYTDELRLAPDAHVAFNPYGLANFAGGPIDMEIGPFIDGSSLTPSDFDTAQLHMWWDKLPDFHGTRADVYFNDDGFLARATYEATLPDGGCLVLDELDFITTNAAGEVRRWEVWEEPSAWDAMTTLVFGKPGRDLTFEEFVGGFKWPT